MAQAHSESNTRDVADSPLPGALTEALIEQSSLSVVVYRPDGRIVQVNAAFERLFGLTQRDIPPDYSVLTDPQLDRLGVLTAVRRAFTGERVVLPPVRYDAAEVALNGHVTWTQAHLYPVFAQGQMLSAVVLVHVDVSERVAAEESLRTEGERLRIALEAGRMGAWDWDIASGRVEWSETLEQIHGIPSGSFGGTWEDYRRDIHPDDLQAVTDATTRTLAGQPHHLTYRIIRPDGELRWVDARGRLFRDPQGRPMRLVGVCTDITERKRDADQRQFLLEASEMLASSLDHETTLANLARLAVPRLADWCAVDLADEQGRLRRLAVAHQDPAKVQLAHQLERQYPADPTTDRGAYRVLHTGEVAWVPEITDELLAAYALDGEHLRIMTELGLRSYLGVPLASKSRVFGVLGLVAAESGRRFGEADLALARELARRAVAAIENSLLHSELRAQRDRLVEQERALELQGEQLRGQAATLMAQHEELRRKTGLLEIANSELQRALDEAVRSRQRLEESERRFRQAADSAPVLIWTAGLDGSFDWFNRPWLTFTGHMSEEERGTGWRRSVHPDDLPRLLQGSEQSSASGRPWRAEFRLRRHDGAYRWMLGHAVPRTSVDGEPLGYIGSCIDITEHRETEEALRRSETLLARIIDSAMDAIVSVDESQRIVAFNAAAERMFGHDAASMFGAPLERLIPARFRHTHEAHVAAFGRTGVTSRSMGPLHPLRALRADGSEFPIEATISQAEAGGRKIYSVIIRDIAGRLRTEERKSYLEEATRVLSRSLEYEETLRVLTRHAVPFLADYCSVDLLTEAGTIVRVSSSHVDPAREALVREVWQRYPYDANERLGAPEVIRTAEPIFIPELPEEAITGFARDDEHARLLRELGPRSYICVPLMARGQTSGALSLVMSDSARRYTEEDLELAMELGRRAGTAVDNARLYRAEQAARVEAEAANRAKVEFLAKMSHELRTPLNAIAGYTQLLEMGIHGPITDRQRESLARIMRSEEHLLSLINDLLNYAKVEAGQVQYHVEPVHLASMLPGLEALVRPQIEARKLHYAFTAPDDSLLVLADQEKLFQVLLNLLSNAAKFTEAGGSLRVACEADAEVVRIAVHDTGRGIPADKLELIFEPFVQLDRSFTSNHEGTGLGLAISRDLARGMRGDLTVRSAPGSGSTFTLVLPRVV